MRLRDAMALGTIADDDRDLPGEDLRTSHAKEVKQSPSGAEAVSLSECLMQTSRADFYIHSKCIVYMGSP